MQERIQVWKIKKGSALAVCENFRRTVETLDQASRILPQGVYTSFRTYRRIYALHMQDHFQRLAEGAVLLGHEVQIDPVMIRSALRKILESLEGTDFRVRISVDLEDRVGDIF